MPKISEISVGCQIEKSVSVISSFLHNFRASSDSIKNSGVNSQKFLGTNGTEFSGCLCQSGKRQAAFLLV